MTEKNPPIGLRSWIWQNNTKSLLLLAAFPFLLAGLLWLGLYALFEAGALGGTGPGQMPINATAMANELALEALPFVMIGAFLWVLFGLAFNSWLLDAATGARGVTRAQEPALYNLLENLCISRGLSMPKLQLIESPALNAYASGLTQKGFTITVTRGLMERLDGPEMEGVLGHELTHIINRDVRLLVVTTVIVGMMAFLGRLGWNQLMRPRYPAYHDPYEDRQRRGFSPVLIITLIILPLGYLVALLLRFAISRKREYMADAGAVALTKNPAALASALRKISGLSDVPGVPGDVKQMFIENHDAGFASLFGLFATHPPIKKRIALLEGLAEGPYRPGAALADAGVTGRASEADENPPSVPLAGA